MLLQDENDNAPIFKQDKYTFKIKENNEPGSILATLRATDADVGDNGEVRYSIAGEDAEAFTVDAITGRLRKNQHPPHLPILHPHQSVWPNHCSFCHMFVSPRFLMQYTSD